MSRAIELAKLGFSTTKTNPMVGAVIVYNNRIIGEGFHKKHGGSHAEINALTSVKDEDKPIISESTLYVTLEPCSHFGKTPPCSDRIVTEKIPKVVIGCIDPNPKVAGRGISYLTRNGVEVVMSELASSCEQLISKFRANLSGRPYIHLKWAQSADNFMAKTNTQVWLSNEFTRILTHKYRNQYDAILIGKNTALIDNPELSVREFSGENPVRVLLDSHLEVPQTHKLLSDGHPTLVYNSLYSKTKGAVEYIKVDTSNLDFILKDLFKRGLTSLIVEGGKKVLTSFIAENLWDEAMVITANKNLIEGISSPSITGTLAQNLNLKSDKIQVILNTHLYNEKKR